MKRLSINFVDFWDDFHKKDNYFYHLLSQKYDVSIDADDPDIVFGSYGFGKSNQIEKYASHRSLKIYYTGESDGPRNSPYDASITQHRNLESERHTRLPLWCFFTSWFGENQIVHSRDPSFLTSIDSLLKPKADFERLVDQKKKFCNFLYADVTQERGFWLNQLNRVSNVECAGRALKNTDASILGRGDQFYKLAYISDFMFTLAIENKEVDGYLTEKMLHPLAVFSIPLYWGDPHVESDFDSRCFVNLRNGKIEDVLNEICDIANSKNRILDMLSAPRIRKLGDEASYNPQNILLFIEKAANRKGVL